MDKRPLSQMAGILCNDEAFQRFVARQLALPSHQASATAAAQYLRTQCRIASRRELDSCTTSARRYAGSTLGAGALQRRGTDMVKTLSAFEERRLHKKRKFRARTAASSAQNREANHKAPEITLPKATWDKSPIKRVTSND